MHATGRSPRRKQPVRTPLRIAPAGVSTFKVATGTSEDECMSKIIRFSRRTFGLFAVACMLLPASTSLAIFHPLGPSKDDWGLKYEVQLTAVGGGLVDVAFTLADEGRLKPVHSYTVVALSPRGGGSFAYDAKSQITLKPTADGKRAGQVRIRREFVEKATIRILTFRVDGRPQTQGAAQYDIPLNRFTIKPAPVGSPSAAPSVAAPPAAKVIK